jgi:hypothetical protein
MPAIDVFRLNHSMTFLPDIQIGRSLPPATFPDFNSPLPPVEPVCREAPNPTGKRFDAAGDRAGIFGHVDGVPVAETGNLPLARRQSHGNSKIILKGARNQICAELRGGRRSSDRTSLHDQFPC